MEFIKKLVAIIYIPKWYMFKDDKKDHVEHDEKRPHPSERGFHLLRYIYICMYIIAQSTDVLYTRQKLKYLGLHRRSC